MRYQVVFHSGSYSKVDFETDCYEQALEVKFELTNEMRLGGEKDFYYEIKDTHQARG